MTTASADRRPLTRLWQGFRQTFLAITEPDPRSLTAFRVVLALGVLFDLWQRFVSVQYFYSEEGLLPQAMWEHLYGDRAYYWTVHPWDGPPWLFGALLIVQMLLALALLLGVRTRWASGLSWFLLLSLVLRNPLLFYGGDKLAPILLLIGVFLPLSKRLQRTSLTSLVSRLALFWLLVQMAILYIASGQSKLASIYWLNGSALSNVLEMNMLVRPLGSWFAQFDILLWPVSFLTPWAEMVLPLLFFGRARVRYAALLALLGFNLGIQSMLDVGFFMFYASAGLLGLLPTQFWDDLALLGRRLPGWLRVFRGGPYGVLGAARLPPFVPSAPQSVSPFRALLRGAALPVMAALLVVTLATGLESMKVLRLRYPPPSWTMIRGLNIYQNWGLFTHPTPTASWYVSKARLADDSWVDVLQAGAPVVWTHQRAPNALYSANSKWRVAMAKIGSLEDERLLELTGRTLARYWNDRHAPERAVTALTVYYLWQPLPIEGDRGREWRTWLEWSPRIKAQADEPRADVTAPGSAP